MVIEAGAFDQLAVAVEELAVHVATGLVERVAPRLLEEAHQREVPARDRHLAHPVGRGPNSNAVEQDPLIAAVDPADSRFPAPRSPPTDGFDEPVLMRCRGECGSRPSPGMLT